MALPDRVVADLAFPPQQLNCPDPVGCPVIDELPELTTVTLSSGRPLFRVYDSTWGYDEFNPGWGDARFSPFDDPRSGRRVPAMYLAEGEAAALLETVFHEVHHGAGRAVYEKDLVGQLLAYVSIPEPAVLGDLRDEQLERLHISREQVVSSSAEHYPCNRRLAAQALARRHGGADIQGLVWHSRQAELAGLPPAEVVVLFGGPRFRSRRGQWQLVAPGNRNLYEGPGRLVVDRVAEQLRAVVLP